jgi:hypothetical protein
MLTEVTLISILHFIAASDRRIIGALSLNKSTVCDNQSAIKIKYGSRFQTAHGILFSKLCLIKFIDSKIKFDLILSHRTPALLNWAGDNMPTGFYQICVSPWTAKLGHCSFYFE